MVNQLSNKGSCPQESSTKDLSSPGRGAMKRGSSLAHDFPEAGLRSKMVRHNHTGRHKR